jgi:hypothetical protein
VKELVYGRGGRIIKEVWAKAEDHASGELFWDDGESFGKPCKQLRLISIFLIQSYKPFDIYLISYSKYLNRYHKFMAIACSIEG